MASTARTPAAQTVLPEEIWEEIFLRLDAGADLARASAACTSFRRIVSARRFLRRFRSLHSPPILGFINRGTYQYRGFLPVEPPHRSAKEARPLVQAADFTFSFVPDPSTWGICHATTDGRVLLSRRIFPKIPFEKVFASKNQFQDFLVCDPLHRQYVMIPRIPDSLMASAPSYAQHLLPVLAPAGESDEEESFRVICAVQDKDRVVGFVFSSCNQTWRAIAEAADGRLGFLVIDDRTSTMDLYSKNWQSSGVDAQEWQHDKLIRLPKDFGMRRSWGVLGTVERYVALLASSGSCPELQKFEYFLLDTKTLLLEKVCTSKNDEVYYYFPYARFPPLLALPSI